MAAEGFDRYSRRDVLVRGAGGLLALSASGAVLASPAQAGGVAAEKPSGSLSMIVWQGYDDPKAAKALTKQGVKINAQYASSNDEFVTKLRGGGLGKYDIVTPSHGYIEPLVKANLLAPIDYSRLTFANEYFAPFNRPSWNTFGGKTYSAPLVWGDAPIVYREDLVDNLPASWLDLRNKEYKGKVVLWEDGNGHIMLFSKVLFGSKTPYLITKSQLADVMKVLREVKKNAVTIASGPGDAADVISRGDGALMTEGWAYVKVLIEQKGHKAGLFTPKEGSFAWCDSYCIARDAPNEEAAYAFINTMNAARGQAIVGTDAASAVTNSKSVALQGAAIRKLYHYTNLNKYFGKNNFYKVPPLAPDGKHTTLADWTTAWEQFKTA